VAVRPVAGDSPTLPAARRSPLPARPPAEEVAWGELCGRGFSHRGGDPKRFYRKLQADPQSPRAGVRVTVAPSGEFVGSVRVPERDVDVDGAVVRVAGIAEVCSDPAYRGQGIAGVALPDAMAYCEGTACAASLLHAAPAVAGLYAKYGYAPLTVRYSRLRLPATAAAADGSISSSSGSSVSDAPAPPPLAFATEWLPPGAVVRAADLGSADEVATLSSLHAATCARLGVTGFTHRSQAYWQRWLPCVAGGSFWALELPGAAAGAAGGGSSPVVAYASVVYKGGLKVWDFGAADGLEPSVALGFLLTLATRQAAVEVAAGKAAADAPEVTTLLVPTRLARALVPVAALAAAAPDGGAAATGAAPSVDHDSPADDDVGWMVRPLGGGPGGPEGGKVVVAALQAASADGRLLVWVADSF
jgi:GNAT superfamily N-acetyltransferase